MYYNMKLKLIILPLCLIAVHAFAFEGTVKQTVSNYNGTGANIIMTWYLGAHNCRLDMAASGKDVNSNTVLIMDPAAKTLKTYETTGAGAQKLCFQIGAGSITGGLSISSVSMTQETRQINGYKCEKWIVATSKGTYNIWITRDIAFDWSAYKDFFKSSIEVQALAQQGVKGFALLTEGAGGANSSTTESIAAQSISPSTFEVPAEYKLVDAK
jgi:hypothetical protein